MEGLDDEPPWLDMIRFAQKPWFSRMWVIQEFLSAANPIIMSNRGPISDQHLFLGYLQMASRTENMPLDSRFSLLSSIRFYILLYGAKIIFETAASTPDLLTRLLWKFRDSCATDPRDKVYSLLPLFERGCSSFPGLGETNKFDQDLIILDYNDLTPIEKIYSSVVQSIVAATKKLDIICACQSKTPGFRTSWTPDWRLPWTRASLLVGNMAFHGMTTTKIFNASGSRNSSASFSELLDVLCADGIRHSTILVASSQGPSSREFQVRADAKVDDNVSVEFEGVTLESGQFCDGDFRLWMKLCVKELAYFSELANQPALTDSGDSDKLPSLVSAMSAGGLFSSLSHIEKDSSRGVSMQITVGDLCPGLGEEVYKMIWQSDRFLGRFLEVIQGRTIFLSDSGDFGLGPDHLEEGDVVCVLLGCSVPVVLRKVTTTLLHGIEKEHYLFIGECYIEPIMQGELITSLDKGEVAVQTFELH